VAATQLLVSGICCLLSPLLFNAGVILFILFLLVWGIAVIGDSPQFSALIAETAPREYVGSALTMVNSIGFLVTVFSIEMVNALLLVIGPRTISWLLLPGPLFEHLALKPLYQQDASLIR